MNRGLRTLVIVSEKIFNDKRHKIPRNTDIAIFRVFRRAFCRLREPCISTWNWTSMKDEVVTAETEVEQVLSPSRRSSCQTDR